MEIRFIAEGEEELCNDFHNQIYKTNRTLNQWKWGFIQNNNKKSKPYVVIKEDGKIIGTQAFIPIRMIDKDGIYWTAKSEGTLVNPEYRGRKFFEKMYSILFDYAEENKFAGIWGFTQAVKALLPLGFTVPGKVDQIFIPFTSKSIASMMSKNSSKTSGGLKSNIKKTLLKLAVVPARLLSAMRIALNKKNNLNNIEIRTWDKPDEQSGELSKRFIEKWGGTTIYRDDEYLQWRLFDNAYIKSVVKAIYSDDKLLGWAAYTIGDDGMGYLVDLMAANDKTDYSLKDLIKILLIESVIGCRNMGASGIRGWHVNNHPFDKLICETAKSIGFYHIKQGHSVVLYNCEAGKQRESYTKFDDWYVTRIFTEGVLG